MNKQVKTINLEPNWKNMYRYFMEVKKQDISTFNRMVDKLSKTDWDKIIALGK